mmetsp:Transcript_31123/g.81567  ORF Transcript_31123/g.81567 Transcript_31123/m.81567 type:complete len:274 (+) Transcript_31123:33-854(+)
MSLWWVLGTATVLGRTGALAEWSQIACGSTTDLGFATRTCLQLQVVPGSTSGSCADPEQSNPFGDPVLVDSFNISANSPRIFATLFDDKNPTMSDMSVVVTDFNGTRLGTGSGMMTVLPTGSPGTSGSGVFDLTFECIAPGSKKVFLHTPCSCHAVLQTHYSFNCDGVCNVSGCDYVDGLDGYCDAYAANGCALYPLPDGGPGYECFFNSSLASAQSVWEMSCSLAVHNDPMGTTPLESRQVMCGASYIEVNSTRPVCGTRAEKPGISGCPFR